MKRQLPHHAINLIRCYAWTDCRMRLIQHLPRQPACCPQTLYLLLAPNRHCALNQHHSAATFS